MAYDVDKIIKINVAISPSGLGFANFGSALIIVPFADAKSATYTSDYQILTYSSLTDVLVNFAVDSAGYQMAARWFAQIPSPLDIMIGVTKEDIAAGEPTAVDSLAAFRDKTWWYWTFFSNDFQTDLTQMSTAAVWCDAEMSFLVIGTVDPAVINPDNDANISYVMTQQGSRHVGLFYHSTDPYAGIELSARFSTVIFNGRNTVITGEFKKLPGVPADDLSATAYQRLQSDFIKTAFYTAVSSAGSVDLGRCINTITTSTFGEWWDDIFNLDGFVNTLQVELYNVLTNQTTKVPQTPKGQQLLIDTAMQVGNAFITNGYLGERLFTNPFTGEQQVSNGYFMLTQATDILKLASADRSARKSAPIQVQIFPSGAIHSVVVNVDVL